MSGIPGPARADSHGDESGHYEAGRLDRLRRSLERELDGSRFRLEPFRGGVECFVDVVHRDEGTAVVRSAVVEQRLTRYEGKFDFAEVVAREAIVVRLLTEAGIPAPRLLAWHQRTGASDLSWMLSDYVPHDVVDDVPIEVQSALGQLARRLHKIEPDRVIAARLWPPEPWSEWIVKRIADRVDAARNYVDLPKHCDVVAALRVGIGDRDADARSLLHLDLRGPNLAVVDGEIVAIFDFANALVGDPWLELARIETCGLLTDGFLDGYGLDRPSIEARRSLLTAYALDLQAMLLVVSKEAFDDPVLHLASIENTRQGVSELMAGDSR